MPDDTYDERLLMLIIALDDREGLTAADRRARRWQVRLRAAGRVGEHDPQLEDHSDAGHTTRFQETGAIIQLMDYLSRLPDTLPDDGRVLVHNQIRPSRNLGSYGFRAWLQPMGDRIEVCDCGWAPNLGRHYVRSWRPGEWSTPMGAATLPAGYRQDQKES